MRALRERRSEEDSTQAGTKERSWSLETLMPFLGRAAPSENHLSGNEGSA